MSGNNLITLAIFVSCLGLALCGKECNWNGVLKNGNCKCYDGFNGDKCEVDCGCSQHGKCQSDNTCLCESGWKWSDSQKECVMDCTCSNGAGCIAPNECNCKNDCVNGMCRNGQCVCYNGYTGETCDVLDRTIMPNKDIPMGINLGGVNYYSSEVDFVDVFKQSMMWITQRGNSWNTHELDKISMRDDGYPASLDDDMRLATLLYRTFGIHEETGNYTILYDGEGEIGIKLTENHIMYNGKGRMIVNFPNLGKGGIEMVLTKTNPANPLHNIRVLPPGYENTYKRFPFHPVFLEGLKRYSEVRFMDMMSTNGHQPEPTTWNTRRKPDYTTQAGGYGVAIEHLVDLANVLGANPWFCMPHAADDDYIRQFARYVKANLRKDLKVYMEYSNEVWNGIFRQTQYTQEKGAPMFPNDAKFKQGMKYYNYRSAQIADIWLQEFSGESDRIVTVWAWQTGFQSYTRQALEDLGNRKSSFKAMAITGYFDCDKVAKNHVNEIPNMSMQDFVKYCNSGLPKEKDSFQHYVNVSQANGLKLLMYEGGPSVMEPGAIVNGHNQQAVTDKCIAFNRDDAIEQPVIDVLEAWHSIVVENSGNGWPGGLFNYFSYIGTPSKYGSWGMIEWSGQKLEDVPKYRAVAKYLKKHYPNNLVGPLCSFVQDGSKSYGCYRTSTHSFQCGITSDGGNTWTAFSGLNYKNTDTLVLDGANLVSRKLYVRVVDGVLASDTHYVYSLDSQKWTLMVNFYYYSELMATPVIPRLPDGFFNGLNTNLHCKVSDGDGVVIG